MIGFWSYNSLNLPSTRLPPQDDWPLNAHRRTHFGQHVLWHEYTTASNNSTIDETTADGGGGRHLSAETLEQYRQQGDAAFDSILDLYAKEGQPFLAGDDLFNRLPSQQPVKNNDISRISDQTMSKADLALQNTLSHYNKLPSWVDPEQLARGQRVFLAYLPAIGLSLYYRSLVPGFSIPKIAAVLEATAYLAPPASKTAVRDRLMDTGAFLGACLKSEDVSDILPGGEGWKAALRVRLLHAKVRRRLMSASGKRQWNTHHLGVPINQEDMAATLLAFSTNSLLGCEMMLGRALPVQDRLDYLALWRYLGWLLGVETGDDNRNVDINDPKQQQPQPLDPCGPGWYEPKANPLEHSYSIFQSIIFHSLHPDASSVRIAHHLLKQGRRQDGDSETIKDKDKLEQSDTSWFYFRSLQCRRFIGDELADALQLPLLPTWLGRLRLWCVSQFYLCMITCYTVAGLPWSPFRSRLIRFHRRHMVTFMASWNESHLERMRKRLQLTSTSGSKQGQASVCPFAMVIQNDSAAPDVVQ